MCTSVYVCVSAVYVHAFNSAVSAVSCHAYVCMHASQVASAPQCPCGLSSEVDTHVGAHPAAVEDRDREERTVWIKVNSFCGV